MRLRSAAVLAALVSVSACRFHVPKSARPAAVLGGSALAIAGFVVAQPMPVDSDGDGYNHWFGNDDWSGLLPGMIMMAGGMALAIAALTSSDPPESTVATPAPAPMVAAPPAQVFAQPPDPSALPERPVTVEVLRLAQQVRAATERGKCDDAFTMWTMLRERDQAYADELVRGPVMASCLQ